jgi:hypothetical protein
MLPFQSGSFRLLYRLFYWLKYRCRQIVALLLGLVAAIGWLTLMAELAHIMLPVTDAAATTFPSNTLSMKPDIAPMPLALELTPVMLVWELLSWGSALCLSIVCASYVMRSRRRWLTAVLFGFVAILVTATFMTQPHPLWFVWLSALVLLASALVSHKYATKVRYRRCR